MKNSYFKLGTVFCILVLVIFLGLGIVFTRGRIDEFNREVEWRVSRIDSDLYFLDTNDADLVKQAVTGTWNYYFNKYPSENTGFYSSLIFLRSGREIIESDDLELDNDNTDPNLNDKAHTISDGYDLSKQNGGLFKTDKGIFYTSVMQICYLNTGEHIVKYCAVYRPFQSVIKDNASVYLAGLLLFLLMEAAVMISVFILYRNQKNFEIRNQKLTRGIAHELKTPLAVTKATVENWEYLDDDMRREHSKNIISEVDHMSDMVDKLLEVSQIDGGSAKMNPEAVDLLRVTRTFIDRNSELIRERNIRLTITGEENSYPVYADPDMMDIVIGNFISNAIKYCDREITVGLERTGKKITFSITNDGAVIGKKDLDKIWDIFYTTDKARTDRMSNSGVGLSLVKSILDANKAKYGCTSGSEGTTFRFTMDHCVKSE